MDAAAKVAKVAPEAVAKVAKGAAMSGGAEGAAVVTLMNVLEETARVQALGAEINATRRSRSAFWRAPAGR